MAGERAWSSFSNSVPYITTAATGRESACGCARCTSVSSAACPALGPASAHLLASMDSFEKQVCMLVLPRPSLLNPFITALVQESGLSEVGMNN